MKLSIIIVNYNVKYFLEQCLDSALKSCKSMKVEIYVVDNNSSDGSSAYLKPTFPSINFIENQENQGFSKANNQAIHIASGEYILLLNPDTVIGENTLKRVCYFMDNHLDAGALGVKMIDGFGNFLSESKRGFPSPWNSFCKIFGLSRIFPQSPFFSTYQLQYLDNNKEHKVDVLAGAFMLLRKKTLDKVGLLDESFFMYGEDIDLSYRIKQSGYNNYYFPEKIIHYKGESTKKDVRHIRVFYEAMLIFFRKHYSNYTSPYSVFIHLAVYLRAFLSVLNRYTFAQFKKKSDKRRQVLFVGDPVNSNKAAELFESQLKCECKTFVNAEKEGMLQRITSGTFSDVVFSCNKFSYEEIISLMDACSNKKITFRIFHSGKGIMIAANEVLTQLI